MTGSPRHVLGAQPPPLPTGGQTVVAQKLGTSPRSHNRTLLGGDVSAGVSQPGEPGLQWPPEHRPGDTGVGAPGASAGRGAHRAAGGARWADAQGPMKQGACGGVCCK